ncbi:MAG: hypothetical protein ICV85_22315 [Tolypothrix sp. T3-bin4]|nr:hypothetical protein [Tolypothrix sp. T3-bin4]
MHLNAENPSILGGCDLRFAAPHHAYANAAALRYRRIYLRHGVETVPCSLFPTLTTALIQQALITALLVLIAIDTPRIKYDFLTPALLSWIREDLVRLKTSQISSASPTTARGYLLIEENFPKKSRFDTKINVTNTTRLAMVTQPIASFSFVVISWITYTAAIDSTISVSMAYLDP